MRLLDGFLLTIARLLFLLLLWVMLFEGLLDRDALELGFTLGFLMFNLFMMGEVLEIFWMSVRFVCLGFRRIVKLLYSLGQH